MNDQQRSRQFHAGFSGQPSGSLLLVVHGGYSAVSGWMDASLAKN